MTERTLTERELNRALLARQMLMERVDLPLTKAIERMGYVQAQYAPSSYIGLWTRRNGFERSQLTRALERRSVVQGTLLRGTIHIVPARDYWALANAIGEDGRTWWLSATRRQFPEAQVAALAGELRRLLADGPRRRKELIEALGIPSTLWNGLGGWVNLVRVPPSGTWERRSADIYATAEDWLGTEPNVTRDDGVELLVRRYLAGFGPASRKDIANWAGISMTTLAPSLDRMTLRRFRDERDRELVDLPRAPLPGADAPAPVRFLPTWDATLLVHARRTQILPERFRPLLFDTKTPHSFPSFLVDGQVAGHWKHEGGRVVVSPFEPLPRRARREVDDEAARLNAWLA